MSGSTLLHPMKVVALRTGLSPHVIRVWERRYRAVTPGRTGTHRRLYSEPEIERLKLLQLATEAGHSIGTIAHLDMEALRNLVGSGRMDDGPPLKKLRDERQMVGRAFVERCLENTANLDRAGLETALQDGSLALGQQGVLLHVVAPLAEAVGALWQNGTIGVAHEHFASAVLRTFLGNMGRPFAPRESGPHLITATPPGQLHELGALLVAAMAAKLGWQSTYLGACLSASEIASAALQKPARAVALSIVYPADDPQLESELRQLRSLLPANVALLVGGRAAAGYQRVLNEIGATCSAGALTDFMDVLNALQPIAS